MGQARFRWPWHTTTRVAAMGPRWAWYHVPRTQWYSDSTPKHWGSGTGLFPSSESPPGWTLPPKLGLHLIQNSGCSPQVVDNWGSHNMQLPQQLLWAASRPGNMFQMHTGTQISHQVTHSVALGSTLLRESTMMHDGGDAKKQCYLHTQRVRPHSRGHSGRDYYYRRISEMPSLWSHRQPTIGKRSTSAFW